MTSDLRIPFVATIDSKRTYRNIIHLKLETIDKLKHEHLKFDNDDNLSIANTKKKNYDFCHSVGEIGLFEIYGDNEFCHLFFDVDHIENETEINEMIEYFNKLSEKFGNYSIGCYTNDEYVADKLKITFIDESEKFFSAHVIFYQSKISKSTFKKWFKTTDKYIDVSTWRDILNYKQRIMRHPISNKVYSNKIEYRAGSVVDNEFKPLNNSTNLINLIGDEFEITDEMMKSLGFTVNNEDEEMKWIEDELKRLINEISSDEEGLDIPIDEEIWRYLFEHLPTIHNYNNPSLFSVFMGINSITQDIDQRDKIYNLFFNTCFKSLTDKAKINFDKKHDELIEKPGNVGVLINLIKKTEDVQFINKFIKLIKSAAAAAGNAETETKTEVKKFPPQIIKVKDLKFVSYQEIHSNSNLDNKIELLRRCICYMPNLKCWFSRLEHDTIQIMKPDDINAVLRCCDISDTKQRTEAVNALYTNIAIDECLDFNSLFVGWKYENCEKSDNYEKNIEDFKNCVMLNICSNDVNLFDYLMKRISFMLHHTDKISKVCVVYQGLEGTGKNWFCDIIANIFSRYSSPNTNRDKLTGRFNANEILGRRYVVCNEALDIDGLYSTSEEMKKIIERPEINCEYKGVDSINIKNSLNVDITSNNVKPVLITTTDRRYLNIRTNPINANNRVYWKKYQEEVINRTGFYSDVYIMIYNDYKCDDFLNLPIPITKAKLRLMKVCATIIDKFIMDNLEKFEIGLTQRDIKIKFKAMSEKERKNYSESRFVSEVINKCMEIEDKRNKCIRYRPTEQVLDTYADLANIDVDDDDDDDNDEEEQTEFSNENKQRFDAFIDNKKQTTDKFDYILASDVKDLELKNYLISNGWIYTMKLSKTITKRGYKRQH